MAARNGSNHQFTLARDTWTVFVRATGGGAAANCTGVKGAVSVNYNADTGKYIITLNDKWAGLLGFKATVIDSTGTRHYEVQPSAETVATTKTISISVFGAATATAPALRDLLTTDTLLVELTLSNSQQNPRPY